MVYTLLLACVTTHIVDIVNHTLFVARLHIRIMAVTVILIWLRLMKNARAFSALGESFNKCNGIQGETHTERNINPEATSLPYIVRVVKTGSHLTFSSASASAF